MSSLTRYTHYRVESLMPKGVEHEKLKEAFGTIKDGVESLMPKGVEHRVCEII